MVVARFVFLLLKASMTLRTVFNMLKLRGRGFALAPQSFVNCPTLFPRRWLTVSAASLCSPASETDSENNEVTETHTVRWLPRMPLKKRVRFRRNLPPVAQHRNDPPVSVLVDMLNAQTGDGTDLQNASLNTARNEIDEKLQELQEMSDIQIRDIDLAMEMEGEDEEEEDDTEKTEV